MTPILPEIIDSVYQHSGLIEGENETIDGILADKAAGLYCSFQAFGVIVAPLLGSFVYSSFGDNWFDTCDLFAGLGLVYSLIFLGANVLPDIWRDRRQREAKDQEVLRSSIVQKKYGIMVEAPIMEEDMEEDEGTDDLSSVKFGTIQTLKEGKL